MISNIQSILAPIIVFIVFGAMIYFCSRKKGGGCDKGCGCSKSN